MASQENTLVSLLNSQVVKLLVGAFVIGTAWARFEYKMDSYSEKLLKKIDEHIISDVYDKKIQSMELSELRRAVVVNSESILDLKEAIKPERVEIKNKRYRR